MPPPFDIDWVRAQFPALRLKAGTRPAVFLDAPGGTQVPRRVAEAVADALLSANANLHGAFQTSRAAERIAGEAHRAAADFIGCAPREVVFGPNMTTLTFALSRSIARELSPGDEIIVTKLDHDANHAPWKALCERGIVLREAAFDPRDCTLDLDDFQSKLSAKTKLAAFGYASNAVGTIHDVAFLIRQARAAGALTFLDAVHYAPHGPLDARGLDCDFLVCSSYKFFGPHQGLLYGKAEQLERLRPYKVRPAEDSIPDCFESGTQNHEAMAGVTAAVDYLAELGRRTEPGLAERSRRAQIVAAMEAVRAYERGLAEALIEGLLEIPGLQFFGIREPERFDRRTPTVAARIDGIHPRRIAERLGERGFFVWDGNYYAVNTTEALGVESDGGMARIGLAHYNTAEEVERFLAALGEIARSRL